jgi:hypothetical protein
MPNTFDGAASTQQQVGGVPGVALLSGLALIILPLLAWYVVPRVEIAVGRPLTDTDHFADRTKGTYASRLWNVTWSFTLIICTVIPISGAWLIALLYLVQSLQHLLGQ